MLKNQYEKKVTKCKNRSNSNVNLRMSSIFWIKRMQCLKHKAINQEIKSPQGQ